MTRSRPTLYRLLRPALAATAAAVLLLAVAAAPASPAAAEGGSAGWAAEEQQFVYLLNQARWSPGAVTAAAGLPGGTFLPQPPLAVNADLAASAQARSDEMALHGYFAHQSPVTGEWPNAVARASGYPLPEWWPGEANNIESLHRGSPDPARVLQSFIESPDHRDHVMGQGFFSTHREIGVGLAAAERIWTIHTATRDPSPTFLTGVAFADANGNGRLDLGEGLAGVTVAVDGRSTVTSAGGGWSLAVSPGTYVVEASGGSFGGTASATVRVSEFNVEVDFLTGGGRSEPRAQVRAYALCQGRRPTILGTSDDDELRGTSGPDVIHGLGGDDLIQGLGGDDFICGGPGDDRLYGDEGDDELTAGPGSDRLFGGDGDDTLRGALGLDQADGGAGRDLVALHED